MVLGTLQIAFHCTGRRGLARIVGLAAVEGARIRLAPLTMRHPLLDRSALQQQVLRHYTRAALNEGYKVLASVDILGASSSRGMQRSGAACLVAGLFHDKEHLALGCLNGVPSLHVRCASQCLPQAATCNGHAKAAQHAGCIQSSTALL